MLNALASGGQCRQFVEIKLKPSLVKTAWGLFEGSVMRKQPILKHLTVGDNIGTASCHRAWFMLCWLTPVELGSRAGVRSVEPAGTGMDLFLFGSRCSRYPMCVCMCVCCCCAGGTPAYTPPSLCPAPHHPRGPAEGC